MDKVCVPIALDAFVLCEKSCEGKSKIAPITQPNYVGLRLDNNLIQHDLLNPVDFHRVTPAQQNPRLTRLGTNPPTFRENRLGVHVHWSLPRCYRTATADADSRTPPPTQGVSSDAPERDASQPVFKAIPNRWLLVRRLNLKTCEPTGKLPSLQAWVIESDRKWRIDDVPDDYDLESDVTPFVTYDANAERSNNDDTLQSQAEVYIGDKISLADAADNSPAQVQKRSGKQYLNNLTVMSSNNPFFPDNALHNSNVLSTIDDFRYQDNKHLTKADADYFVFGWHTGTSKDPLKEPSNWTLEERLNALLMQPSVHHDSGSVDGILLHGAIYGVKYRRAEKPESMADQAADKFGRKERLEPLSVGTTALDAVIAFLDAHKDDAQSFFDQNIQDLPSLIVRISQLLYATEDSYDASVKASDLLVQNNYARSAGGTKWTYKPSSKIDAQTGSATAAAARSAKSKTTVELPEGVQEKLKTLNRCQAFLDVAEQVKKSKQWQIFAEWWKYVSNRENSVDQTARNRSTYVASMKQLFREVQEINDRIEANQSNIGSITGAKSEEFKQASLSPFFLRKDPMLCIAGLDTGWPIDFMEKLNVRLSEDVMKGITAEGKDNIAIELDKVAGQFETGMLKTISDQMRIILPGGLGDAALKVLIEAVQRPSTTQGENNRTTGVRSWSKNPFVPLFLEYELYYYHVPKESWELKLRNSPVGHNYRQVRYGIKKDDQSGLDKAQTDYRIISGRTPILPQPVFSLDNTVKIVLDNASANPFDGPGPEDDASAAQQKARLLENIGNLKFISAPLTGITNHLLTRCDGAHVKPTVRVQGQTSVPLQAAITSGTVLARPGQADAGLASQDLKDMLIAAGDQSALTPYANILRFGSNYPHPPFKPVTHGQLAFTKLNIIDKFGQAVCLPEPRPRPRKTDNLPKAPETVHPCLSDYLQPERLSGRFNTVFPEPDVDATKWPQCRFIQLTPSINQEARINAAFLIPKYKDDKSKFVGWSEATDYEQPIFGWVIVNYANNGLQFFLPDGTFYREIRLGGPSGVHAGKKWLPFDPPASAGDVPPSGFVSQLDQLIQRLTDNSDPSGGYLLNFAAMINQSMKNMSYPPSDYAAFANAIVGKPLALVNVGWSLEMAQPAYTYQHMPNLGKIPDRSDQPVEPQDYDFPIKIGDADRPFDGVIGYFLSDNQPQQDQGDKTHWENLFTYFTPGSGDPSDAAIPKMPDSTKVTLIGTDDFQYQTLKPFALDPLAGDADTNMLAKRAEKYTVTTVLMDPYMPIHAYSPILPTKSIQLPAWTIQQAFTRMTAFFSLGPYLVSKDVPKQYNSQFPLKPETWATPKEQQSEQVQAFLNKQEAHVRLPIAGKKGLWKWLQPYSVDGETKFNSLEVDEEDHNLRSDLAPYTYIEGHLQLARPLLKGDIEI